MFPLFYNRKFVFYTTLGIAVILISSQLTSAMNPYRLLLSYLGAVIFVAAFSYRWVKASSYIWLAVLSTAIIMISMILNNIVGENYEDTLIRDLAEFLFFLAIFICPFGIVIGITGSFLLSDKSKK